jgi:Glycosyl transferases group 1.
VECSRKQFASDDEKILIHVSNLRPVKRVDEVLQIFKNVNSKVKSKLIIIGEGPDMEKINEFLENNPDLIGKIRLLGKVNDLYRILQLSDVFHFLQSRKVSVWPHWKRWLQTRL